jgi:uncharacterized membrane protein
MNEILKQWTIELIAYLFGLLLGICFVIGSILTLGMIIVLCPFLLILLAIGIIMGKQKPIYYGCMERMERMERMKQTKTRKENENKNESIN